jgi:hypothetical protein
MRIERVTRLFALTFGVIAMIGSWSTAGAQSHEAHGAAAESRQQRHHGDQGPLVKAVREATKNFDKVDEAVRQGYQLQFGCVSGGEFGAMGLHFVNFDKVFDEGTLDVANPEIILYEPTRNGGVRITGADFLVLAADWDAKNEGPPQLMGQLFHLFESPNRFGLPPFYTLHVWAWKENPAGTFGNWNPNVDCEAFAPTPSADR